MSPRLSSRDSVCRWEKDLKDPASLQQSTNQSGRKQAGLTQTGENTSLWSDETEPELFTFSLRITLGGVQPSTSPAASLRWSVVAAAAASSWGPDGWEQAQWPWLQSGLLSSPFLTLVAASDGSNKGRKCPIIKENFQPALEERVCVCARACICML